MLEPIDDPAIPTLAALLDRAELVKCLTPFVRAEWGQLQELEFPVLKRNPGKRCTVEIGLRTTRGYHELC